MLIKSFITKTWGQSRVDLAHGFIKYFIVSLSGVGLVGEGSSEVVGSSCWSITVVVTSWRHCCCSSWRSSWVTCQPIRDQYCYVPTNQKSALFNVDQSEISKSVYLCQPIRDEYYLSCLLHLLTLVSPPWYEEERPTCLTTCSGRRLGHTGCGISYIRLFCCHLKIWWS